MENKELRQKRRTARNREMIKCGHSPCLEDFLEEGGLSSVLVSGVLSFTLFLEGPSSDRCCQIFQDLLQEIF